MTQLRAAVAAAGLLLMCACGTGDRPDELVPQAAGYGQATEADSCAAEWPKNRADARAKGLRDGEARRQADQRRIECERGKQPQRSGPQQPCDSRGAVLTDLASVPRNPKSAAIYLSCGQVSAERGFPLHALERPGVGGGTPQEGITTLVDAYLAGVNADEQAAGYGGAINDRELVESVTIEGDAVAVDFSEKMLRSPLLGATAFNDQLVAELSATLLQRAGSVRFSIAGSCGRFAEAVYGTPECPDPVTRNRSAGTVGAAHSNGGPR